MSRFLGKGISVCYVCYLDYIKYENQQFIPFKFKERRHHLDTTIYNIHEIRTMINEDQTDRILQFINRITYSKLCENEKASLLEDCFIKIFHLAQLNFEYLDYQRRKIKHKIKDFQPQIDNKLDQINNKLQVLHDNAKGIIDKRRYYRQYRTTLRVYEALLRSTPIVNCEAVRICSICHKAFMSEKYLKIHHTNKHSNIPYPSNDVYIEPASESVDRKEEDDDQQQQQQILEEIKPPKRDYLEEDNKKPEEEEEERRNPFKEQIDQLIEMNKQTQQQIKKLMECKNQALEWSGLQHEMPVPKEYGDEIQQLQNTLTALENKMKQMKEKRLNISKVDPITVQPLPPPPPQVIYKEVSKKEKSISPQEEPEEEEQKEPTPPPSPVEIKKEPETKPIAKPKPKPIEKPKPKPKPKAEKGPKLNEDEFFLIFDIPSTLKPKSIPSPCIYKLTKDKKVWEVILQIQNDFNIQNDQISSNPRFFSLVVDLGNEKDIPLNPLASLEETPLYTHNIRTLKFKHSYKKSYPDPPKQLNYKDYTKKVDDQRLTEYMSSVVYAKEDITEPVSPPVDVIKKSIKDELLQRLKDDQDMSDSELNSLSITTRTMMASESSNEFESFVQFSPQITPPLNPLQAEPPSPNKLSLDSSFHTQSDKGNSKDKSKSSSSVLSSSSSSNNSKGTPPPLVDINKGKKKTANNNNTNPDIAIIQADEEPKKVKDNNNYKNRLPDEETIERKENPAKKESKPKKEEEYENKIELPTAETVENNNNNNKPRIPPPSPQPYSSIHRKDRNRSSSRDAPLLHKRQSSESSLPPPEKPENDESKKLTRNTSDGDFDKYKSEEISGIKIQNQGRRHLIDDENQPPPSPTDNTFSVAVKGNIEEISKQQNIARKHLIGDDDDDDDDQSSSSQQIDNSFSVPVKGNIEEISQNQNQARRHLVENNNNNKAGREGKDDFIESFDQQEPPQPLQRQQRQEIEQQEPPPTVNKTPTRNPLADNSPPSEGDISEFSDDDVDVINNII